MFIHYVELHITSRKKRHCPDFKISLSATKRAFAVFLLQSHCKYDIQLTMEEQPFVTVFEAVSFEVLGFESVRARKW